MQLVCWAVRVGLSPHRGMTQHPALETVLTWSQEGSSLPSYPCSSHIRGAPFFSLSLSFLISAMSVGVFWAHPLGQALCWVWGPLRVLQLVTLQVFLRQYLNCLPFPEASHYNHLDIELQNGRMKGISHRRLGFYAEKWWKWRMVRTDTAFLGEYDDIIRNMYLVFLPFLAQSF